MDQIGIFCFDFVYGLGQRNIKDKAKEGKVCEFGAATQMQTPEGIKKTGKTMEKQSPSSLRWGILRDAFLPRSRSSQADNSLQVGMNQVSRRTFHGYNLIPCRLLEGEKAQEISRCSSEKNDVYVSYTLPLDRSSTLVLRQRVENHIDFDDFDTCRKFNIDNTGLVCHWPSEDVLAHFCLSHADIFRSKRILELGAGYGLAGLVIAASTDASEVVISDGNPKVVDYIQHNINANSGAFADTKVRSMILHWDQDQKSSSFSTFDIIVASDCTFFKEFHGGLAQTVKSLLKDSQDSEAIFISPRRGDSLDKFLEKITETGLHFNVTENYDKEVWERHQKCLHGASTNYEKDHCYPVLVRITS